MNYAPLVRLNGLSAQIPDGLPGIFHTVQVMRELVKQYRVDPGIRQAAVSAIFTTPAKMELGEVDALLTFVQRRVRYVKDINGVETIATPDKTLLSRIGDCDDQSTLLAALFESVGYPTRFIVAGYVDPSQVEHVYLQVFADGAWIDCDPTERHPLGWSPPDPLILYVENL